MLVSFSYNVSDVGCSMAFQLHVHSDKGIYNTEHDVGCENTS